MRLGTALLRLLLLAVVAVGVISMHTVGHPGEHHSWAARSADDAGHASAAAAWRPG